MAKTRCYRIDLDLFPAAIGRWCANVALCALFSLSSFFSFRTSCFSRLRFLVVVVVAWIIAAFASATSVGATRILRLFIAGTIHQWGQLRTVRLQHQIATQHAQWDALWRFKYEDVEWRFNVWFGCGLRLRITLRIHEQSTEYWILFLMGLLFDWISILVLVFGWVWKRRGESRKCQIRCVSYSIGYNPI